MRNITFGLEKQNFKFLITDYLNDFVQLFTSLLVVHFFIWSNGYLKVLMKQYREYLLATLSPCTVIFNSYDNRPSTKDIKHQVRGAKLSQIVSVDLSKKVSTSQEKFLKTKRC